MKNPIEKIVTDEHGEDRTERWFHDPVRRYESLDAADQAREQAFNRRGLSVSIDGTTCFMLKDNKSTLRRSGQWAEGQTPLVKR